MSRISPQRLNLTALAQDGAPLADSTPVRDLPRLAAESPFLADEGSSEAVVQWQARAELRPRTGTDGDLWLHLQASTELPLTCQRCMTAVSVPLAIEQWFRFVESEDIAMAEDDEAEEDLLVLEPQLDLLNLLEDELLMALPVVPMHDECPQTPIFSVGDAEAPEVDAKPNPFAMLADLKKK